MTIILTAFVSDYLSMVYHQIVFGYQITTKMSLTDSLDPSTLLSAWIVALSAAALGLWIATEVLGRYDRNEGSLSAAVAILLVLWSFALILGFSPWRRTTFGGDDMTVAVIFCLNWIGVLALALVVQTAVRHEVAVTRHRSRRPLALRGTRHARAEAQATARRAMEARRLHHVLANQESTVPALAREGRMREADRQLAASQDLAHQLAQNADEG